MRRITQTPLALALLGLPIQAQTTTFNLADIDDPFGSNTQEFGRSLDVSGPFGVVGSDDGAWLLERQDSGLWTLGPELTPFDGNSNIGFGRAVAMDGERLAIGAPTDSGSGVETGSVYLFNRFGDQWFPGAKLFLPSALDQVEFAASLALDGDRLVVGSPRAKSPFNNARTGLVHVFDRQPDGNWALDATLAVQSGADDLRFGHAVALDGDRLVVGAPYEDLVFKAGTAFVFERGSDGSWKLIRELTPMGTQINDAYGTAVALVDEEIAVGAPRYDGATLDSGAVVMWGLAGNLWKEGALLEAPSILFGDRMGTSVVFDEDVLYSGSPGEDGAGTTWKGATRRFIRLSGGGWGLSGSFQAPSLALAWYSGSALALDDGLLLIGSPGSNEAIGGTPGAVEVLWSYESSETPGPEWIGVDSGGCGPQVRLDATLPALVPSTDFAVETEAVDPGLVGFVLIGFGVDPTGPDPLNLGIALYPELTTTPAPLLLPATSDVPTAIPIPAGPGLAGLKLWLQSVWLDPACGVGPLSLTSSRCLTLVLGQP